MYHWTNCGILKHIGLILYQKNVLGDERCKVAYRWSLLRATFWPQNWGIYLPLSWCHHFCLLPSIAIVLRKQYVSLYELLILNVYKHILKRYTNLYDFCRCFSPQLSCRTMYTITIIALYCEGRNLSTI